MWQQFLIGAVVVLLVVGIILTVVRLWAIPALQSRGADAGIAGEATLAALQTQQALTPRPTATNVVVPAAQPTVAPTGAVQTPAPTPMPTTAVAVAPTIQPTPAPLVAPVEQQTVTALASATGVGSGVPNVNGTPYPLPTAAPEVAAAVSDAYSHYWSVRADAFLNLDPTDLDQVAAGDELAALQKSINDFRAQGKALDTDVQHHFTVVTVIDDQAVVSDRFRDSSIYVSPDDHTPLPGQVKPDSPDTAPEVQALYKLELIDGTWKVVQG